MFITFVFQNFLQCCKSTNNLQLHTRYKNTQLTTSLLTDQFRERPLELYQVVYSISLISPSMRRLLSYYVRHIIQRVLSVHVAVISDEVSQQRL